MHTHKRCCNIRGAKLLLKKNMPGFPGTTLALNIRNVQPVTRRLNDPYSIRPDGSDPPVLIAYRGCCISKLFYTKKSHPEYRSIADAMFWGVYISILFFLFCSYVCTYCLLRVRE